MDSQSLTVNSTTASSTYAVNTINTNTNATVNTTYWSDNTQLTVDPYINNSNWLWTYQGQITDKYVDKKEVEELVDNYLNKKDKNMNNDFSFGPFNTKDIRLSLYGMAIKNKSGKWVSYDKATHRLMDVEVFNIDIDSTKVFYKIPKAVNDVVAGDIILHNGKPMFVEEVLNNNKFAVIDPYEGTAITILAPVSPFGFNFITKIVSLTDCMPEASEDNPFGNLLPFMLGDNNSLMLAMMLNKGAGDIDPMIFAAMSGNSNMLPLLFMTMLNKKEKATE